MITIFDFPVLTLARTDVQRSYRDPGSLTLRELVQNTVQ